MKNELNVGDKVLVFEYVRSLGINQNYNSFINGEVVKKELSHNLAYHGSPWHVINYTVLGEDGNIYYGNYNEPVLGDSFFLKKEHYLKYLKHNKELLESQNVIDMINTYHQELLQTIKESEHLLKEIEALERPIKLQRRKNNEK